jgi:radical SAM protein with 4Fe4S-binding SPASM domain
MGDLLHQALHTSHLVQQSVHHERYFLHGPFAPEAIPSASPDGRILRVLWDRHDGRPAGDRLRGAGLQESDDELRRRVERLRDFRLLVHHDADEMRAYHEWLEANVPALPQIDQVELTNACPLECGFCPRGRGKMRRPEGLLDLSILRDLVSQLPTGHQNKTLGLHHFGESLLHTRAAEAVRIVREAGFEPELSFNPVFLSQKLVAELLEACPGVLIASLDGLDTPTLRAMRGRRAGTFPDAAAKLEMLLRAACAVARPPMVVVSMVGTTINRHQWHDFVRRYTRTDLPFLRPVIRLLNDFGDPSLAPLSEDHLHILCSMPYGLVSVLWDGTVVACCQDYDGVMAFGNLREESLEAIWKGERLRKFREQWKAEAFAEGHPCARCRWRPGNYMVQTKVPLTDAWWEPFFAEEPGASPPRAG